MRFHKLNGAGNDFIIINNIEEKLPAGSFAGLAKKLCERHLSIGADGLMIIEKSDMADFKMLFYNSDGSVGEMCGNGARCICRYGFEAGLSGKSQTVETASGIVTGKRLDARRYKIEMTKPTVINLDCEVEYAGAGVGCSYIELGVPGLPHAVVNMPGLRGLDERVLFELGRGIRCCAEFPKGVNANFYDITGKDAVFMRTYERGVEDFTYACGSGAVSVALVLYLKGELSGNHLDAEVTGGRLEVDIEKNGEDFILYLTGPTNMVAAGEVLDEEL